MALPVVYANTPYAGYVAWDAFNIQYLGTSYTIGAGNTSARWVWWRYNTGGASTVIEAGADVPDGVITNELLNPGFEESDPADAYLPRYWLRPVSGGRYYNVNHTTLLTAAEFFSGTQSVALTTGLAGATGPSIQKLATLTEGDTYRLTFRAKATAGYTGGLYCMLLNATGTTEVLRFATLNPTPTLTQTWQIYSGTIVIPVGAASSRLMICSYNKAVGQVAYVDDVEFGENPIAGLTDDDLVLFGNKNGIPFRVQSTSFIDGDLLVDGSVGVQALAAKVIVANDVYSENAYLGYIKADYIESGILESTISIVKGGLIVGSGITITQANGIMVAGPTGNTQIPTDGSSVVLNGQVVASALTVLGNSKIQGKTNELSTGSVLTVAAGTTPPATGPVITAEYPTHQIAGGPAIGMPDPRGLVSLSAESATSFLQTCSDWGKTVTIEKVTKQANGDYTDAAVEFNMVTARSEIRSAYGGITVLGTEVYTLGQTSHMASNSDDYDWWVYQWHWTGVASPGQSRFTYVNRFQFQPSSNYGSFVGWDPVIGNDGTDLLIFQNGLVGWGVSKYTTAGSYVATTALWNDAGRTSRLTALRNASGIIGTAADTGTMRWWVTTTGAGNVYCFDTTGIRVTANEFSGPIQPTGFMWDGTRFSVRDITQVYDFSQIQDTDLATNKINAVQTWRLNNSTGPAYATYETSASAPSTTITIPKRAWVRLTSPSPIPDDPTNASDPDALTFYLARGATPTNANYKRIPPFFGGTDKGTLSVLLDTLTAASGAAPPTTTSFLTTSSGVITSNGLTPTWTLKGDGSGTLGQAAWDTAGNWSWTTGMQTGAMRIAAAAQSIPNDVALPYTTATLATVSYNSGCDVSVANTIKIITPGFYVVNASAMFDNGGAVAGSRRLMHVLVNGVIQGRAETRAMDNSEYYTGNIAFQTYLNAADTLTLQLYQNGGAALSTLATHLPRLSVSKVSSQGSKGDAGTNGTNGSAGLITLSATAPIPGGTAPGTVILRTAT